MANCMSYITLDPVIDKSIEIFSNQLKTQFKWKKSTKEALANLQKNLPQIQAVIYFASSNEQNTDQNPHFNEWLWQLRDAIDDAMDMLDEVEYRELEKQVIKNRRLRWVRYVLKSMEKIVKRSINLDTSLKRLEKAVQELDGVSTNASSFLGLVKDAKQENQEQQLELYRARETVSWPENDLIGRSKEKEIVMNWLLSNPSNHEHQALAHGGTGSNISLLSIVGHGGMGKTTLLQHIYEEDEMTKEFDLKMWVCVSNNFDVKKIIADMLECLYMERPRLETLGALQRSLKKELMSKKFLLVLDDIWEEDEEKDKRKWEGVLAPLASGSFGSKILITTRMDSVALMLANVIKEEKKTVKLEGLEEDECLQILNSHAFDGVEKPPDEFENLRAVARDIVKKLARSPLAAKVIGGVLNENLNEGHWRKVLESNLLGRNSINSILILSYIVLPNPIKSCFAFCGMFAHDHKFDKDDLIRMWIALGFVQPSHDQEETMEDIGGRYFDVLVKNSFFEKFGEIHSYYKMHDLQYKLAQSIFVQEYLRVEDGTKLPSEIPKTLRHLFLQTTDLNVLRKIEEFKHLHSLFLFYEDSNQDLSKTLVKIFKASRCLRLLYIVAPCLKKIPKEIKKLIHLRYLRIGTELTRLPRSLRHLYSLQYIIYDHSWSSSDDIPPIRINKLVNLRYMTLPKSCISSNRAIGKLKSLQNLNMFYLRDKSGYRIGELENMNDLCILGIYNLENVKDVREACSAKLCDKRRLTELTLCWSKTDLRNINLDENMLLDNLQPPPECLKNLSIKRYMGARSAIWMNNINHISNLEKIELTDCSNWETLPPFGQLRSLKNLKLGNMSVVKWLESKFNGNYKYGAFPLLEVLHITNLRALEDWFEEEGVAAQDGCLFPRLIELEIYDCPNLKELPCLPHQLKRLKIRSTGWKTLNFCSISKSIIPLETLEVSDCPNIQSLSLADEISRLAALRSLKITKCPNLMISPGEEVEDINNNCHMMMLNDLCISDPLVLQMEPLRSITYLQKLIISDNDELVSFPYEAEKWILNVRSSLSELQFSHLKSLQSLPSSLESLSSLKRLYIYDVPMLRELPNLPPSLDRLIIHS